MKLVCIGIGGSGAGCLEVVVHMAALGLYPPDCEVVPVALDPDRGHPRISGMTTFLVSYSDLRTAGAAESLNSGGLFGARIQRNQALNSTKPADQENLFSVLGLADQRRRALASLFFRDEEIGRPDSHEFANGYYGRANAGVCFFSDPAGKERLLAALRQHLLRDDSRVVLFGSAFGGTGAAGLVHAARMLRDDEQLKARNIPIAIVQLEPYFKPDASTIPRDRGFVNLPATFERRTGAAYQFLDNLAKNNNLPFNVLYPLGVRDPSVFPPDWFKRDQQDNPHLWLEYLAALAVRDFTLNPSESSTGEVRLRRVALPSVFGEPLATMRKLLYASACMRAVGASVVLPLLSDRFKDADRVPGHPWIHDVITESGSSPALFRKHVHASLGLLDVILGHAGILPAAWRGSGSTWVDPETGAEQHSGDAELQRREEMTRKTRDSFPSGFLPAYETLNPSLLLQDCDPSAMFADYSKPNGDAGLPIRALHRWALESMVIPAGQQAQQGRRDYQLVQQESESAGDEAKNLATISDDTFVAVAAKEALQRLARAPWKSPPDSPVSDPNEYPSIWAPAIIYWDMLYRAAPRAEVRYIHLGLLYLVMMRYQQHVKVPVHAFPLDHPGLTSVIRSTFPLPEYDATFRHDQHVLGLYLRPTPLFGPQVPKLDEVVGFLYPDTIVVPAAGLSEANAIILRDLGKYAAGIMFPRLLRTLCANWHEALQASGIPDADRKGPKFLELLDVFPDDPNLAADLSERYASFPLDAPPWITRLFAKIEAGVAS